MRYLLITLAICFFISCGTISHKKQNRQDKEYSLQEGTKNILIDSLNTNKSFHWFDNSLLIFGTSNKLYKTGVGFVLYDTISNKIKFNAIGEGGDEDFIVPHFFKTIDTLDPILLLCNVGAEYTYGVRIYKLERNKIQEIGYMDIALDINPYESDTDPVPFTEISINNDTLNFSFTKQIASNFQGLNEKIYKTGELKYIYANDKLIKQAK